MPQESPSIETFLRRSFSSNGSGLDNLYGFLLAGDLPDQMKSKPSAIESAAAVLIAATSAMLPAAQLRGIIDLDDLREPASSLLHKIKNGLPASAGDEPNPSDDTVVVFDDRSAWLRTPVLRNDDTALTSYLRIRQAREPVSNAVDPSQSVTIISDAIPESARPDVVAVFMSNSPALDVAILGDTAMPLSYPQCVKQPLSAFCKENLDGRRLLLQETRVLADNKAIVVALGRHAVETQGQDDNYMFALESVISEARRQSLRPDGTFAEVYVVSIGSGPNDTAKEVVKFRNQTLLSVADELNIHVIPWHEVATQHPEYFAEDGVELTEEGSRAYATEIANHVSNTGVETDTTREGEEVDIADEIADVEEPVDIADEVTDNEPDTIRGGNESTRMPEYTEQSAYVLAEKLGLPALNEALIAQFKVFMDSGMESEVDIAYVADIYRDRPDLVHPVDGVSNYPQPIATDMDYFTFSPDACTAERRMYIEQAAFWKATSAFYNWLVRNDPRFVGLPLSNLEGGDAWSPDVHIEHDEDNPAIDIRTVLMGSQGGANNGPAFIMGNRELHNQELEETIIRFWHSLRFNGNHLVKYVIYGNEALDNVLDGLRQPNGRKFYKYKTDHPEHIHVALNVFSEEISLSGGPSYKRPCADGSPNTTFAEVSAMNMEWYYKIFPDALRPGEVPIEPVVEPVIDIEDELLDMVEDAPTVEQGSRIGPRLRTDYEQRIDASNLSTEQKQFLKTITQAIDEAYQESDPNYAVVMPVLVAQVVKETGWGTSPLAREANNYGGHKAGDDYTGPVMMVKDDERVNGVLVESAFMVFDTPADSFRYMIRSFNESEYYIDGVRCAGVSPEAFAAGIKDHIADDCVTILADHDTDRYLEDGSPNPLWQPGYATAVDYDKRVLETMYSTVIHELYDY